MIMSKLEQNDFLYSVISNPEVLLNEHEPFTFHSISDKVDKSIVFKNEVQMIEVVGPYNGELYLSDQYLMFKSNGKLTSKE
jgi:hypothetical protein